MGEYEGQTRKGRPLARPDLLPHEELLPGGADEKVHLINATLNPNVCSQPRAAQVELIKWKENIHTFG